MDTNTTQYLHEGIEVTLTGRTATKNGRRGKVITIYEICPSDTENGTFSRWVALEELFTISP